MSDISVKHRTTATFVITHGIGAGTKQVCFAPRRVKARIIFQAVELVRMESCPAHFVLPLVGLAADKITRDGYTLKM